MSKLEIPELTADQMIEVDRLMIEDYKISLIQMMENAGHCLSKLARDRFFEENFLGKRAIVLAGSGGNGGGALVSARRMVNNGARVQVWLAKESDEYKGIPGHQLEILYHLEAEIIECDAEPNLDSPDLIIDGIIGYSLRGNPRGSAEKMIRWANSQNTPILALDVPSGFDPKDGTASEPVIKAAVTMTLALPKVGLSTDANETIVGELYLADISVPPSLYKRIGVDLRGESPFAKREIVRLR